TPIGSSAKTVKFRGGGKENHAFNFFFDGTGILTHRTVSEQIDELNSLIYHYNGDIHESNYIKIFWGTQSEFRGRLESFEQINLMMDTDGTPLRSEEHTSELQSREHL